MFAVVETVRHVVTTERLDKARGKIVVVAGGAIGRCVTNRLRSHGCRAFNIPVRLLDSAESNLASELLSEASVLVLLSGKGADFCVRNISSDTVIVNDTNSSVCTALRC